MSTQAKKKAPAKKKGVKNVKKEIPKKKRSIKGVIMRPGAVADFLHNGFIRVTTRKILIDAVKKMNKNEIKNFIAAVLAELDEKSRASVLRRFWRETKPGLSQQDKADLLMGRRIRKISESAGKKKK